MSAPARQGWGICNAFRKYGSCDKMGCRWAHAHVPPALQGVEGLVLADLGECTYDAKTNTFTPKDGLDVEGIIANVRAELAEVGIFNEIDGDAGDLGNSGFQGPP